MYSNTFVMTQNNIEINPLKMTFLNTLEFAQELDKTDPLKDLRSEYHIPPHLDGKSIYFCGNSLGLQPKVTKSFIEKELEIWKNIGVEGHFKGEDPWVNIQKKFKKPLAHIVGAKESEVVAMNNLTTNLHLLLASFYQPSGKRVKILLEKGAFPSDHYVVESHLKMRGVSPEQHMVLIEPEEGELFTTEEIVNKIQALGDELALVFLPGIQYYTGQLFDLKAITKAAHDVGAFVGYDLAHAAGNVTLSLHDDQVDFAAWCSYKYMNSGPGGMSGSFIHEKHCNNPDFPKLTGWWGHDLETRFDMDNQFVPSKGADAWILSNTNVIAASAYLASLSIFEKTNMSDLRTKSEKLTGYLEFLLSENDLLAANVNIITPTNPQERGCQLSLSLSNNGKSIFDGLIEAGVILDWREPNVIRVAPTPMYNTFEEVYEFTEILKRLIRENN
jgi:kynureninase